MAKDKNKIIVYRDWKAVFDDLTDREAGQLIKHFFSYVNDENPVLTNRVLKASFILIEKQLKRDLKLWEAKVEQCRSAGLKSAEVRKQNKTNVNERKQTSTNLTVNDTVNVNVYNSYIDEIKNSQWIETMYLLFKLKKGSISKLIDKFLLHLQTEEKQHDNISEFKKHFKNWLVILNRNNELEDFKITRNRNGML